MRVKELTDILQALDPEAQVLITTAPSLAAFESTIRGVMVRRNDSPYGGIKGDVLIFEDRPIRYCVKKEVMA